MNKYLLTCLLFGATLAANATDSAPIISFNTAVYDNVGPDNAFTISIGGNGGGNITLDCGLGPQDFELKPAVFDNDSKTISATTITCHVTEAGMVYIYGDPSAIDYIDFSGCYIRNIDMASLSNLQILNLEHNELTGLDLSAFEKLQAVYLADNPYSQATPLKIGKNHPELTILQIGTSYYLDQEFDLSDYPQMISFDAYAARDLRRLDPSGCPKLVQLSIDVTQVASLDVSNNPELAILNISDTPITHIDVSHNPKLQQLYCDHSGQNYMQYKINSLDLSNNPNLYYLFAGYNNLTEIDLSNNPKLFHLSLACNRLTDIDLSANTNLYNVNLRNNYIDFAHLPAPGEWGEYYYQQNPQPVAKSFKVGHELDFSGMLRPGSSTFATLYKVNEDDPMNPVKLPADAFSFVDGKLTLLSEQPDSVFVSFYNTELSQYPQTTSNFVVKSEAAYGQPNLCISMLPAVDTGKPVTFSVAMQGASASNPKQLYVDFGNGTSTTLSVTGSALADATTLSATRSGGSYVTISVPEGETLTALAVDGMQLYSIDLSKATGLQGLSLKGTGLYTLELEQLRNLAELELCGNSLYTLSIAGKNEYFAKTRLSRLSAPGNGIHSFVSDGLEGVEYIDLSDNMLGEFNFESCHRTKYLNVARNNISTADIQRCAELVTLDISDNRISELNHPTEAVLENVNLSGNCFTIATLPDPALYSGTYTYTPQAPIVIPVKGPGVSLSSQLRELNGANTSFHWFKADGTPLAEGTDYTLSEGRTRFLNTDLGHVYCALTHPAFPALSVADNSAIYTTELEVAPVPSNKVASFTTPTGGQTASLSLAATTAGTQIFIDWQGDGLDFTLYDLGDTYRLFQATTTAGAEVGVYCYDDGAPISVFSISGITMGSADISRLTDAHAITLSGSGLESISLPGGDKLRELILDGNALNSIDFGNQLNLVSLSLASNNLDGVFDLSIFRNLQLAGLGNNLLDGVKLDNPMLWFLDASRNYIADIDLSGAPALEQLALSYNQLHEVDVEDLAQLRVLTIDHNYFTFNTLPEVKPVYALYVYGDQAPVQAITDGLNVDLSEFAEVSDTPTLYRWFVGTPQLDEAGEWTGEELVEGEDFSIIDGISTFTRDYSNLVGLMTNELFPGITLFCEPVSVSSVAAIGLDSPAADNSVYNLQGIRVGSAADFSRLPKGIYIVGGKKVMK